MKKRYFFYSLLIILLAYLIYYRIEANKKIANSGDKAKSKEPGKTDDKPVDVFGVVVHGANFNSSIDVTGSIEPNETVVLHSETSGLVTSINFKEGTPIKKGQVLLRINDKDIQAQLQQAKTKEALSATTEKRAKLLLAKNAISQEEYDAALADLNSLKAQTQLIKVQLDKTIIKAPFSGKIGLRSISVGEYLVPSTAIATITMIDPVKIVFSVPEKYALLIKPNTLINFMVEGATTQHHAKVFAIEPSINTQTRTLKIKALATNANHQLLPGSFAKINIALSTLKNAILIPSEAVIPVLQGKMVYICKNGKAQKVNIQTGIRTTTDVVVNKGLNIGDTVLTSGAMILKPDMPIHVTIGKH